MKPGFRLGLSDTAQSDLNMTCHSSWGLNLRTLGSLCSEVRTLSASTETTADYSPADVLPHKRQKGMMIPTKLLGLAESLGEYNYVGRYFSPETGAKWAEEFDSLMQRFWLEFTWHLNSANPTSCPNLCPKIWDRWGEHFIGICGEKAATPENTHINKPGARQMQECSKLVLQLKADHVNRLGRTT